MRLLVVTGRGDKSRKLLFDALDQLKERFGRVSLVTPYSDPGILLEWAVANGMQLAWHGSPYTTPTPFDAVVAMNCGIKSTIALRYAWARRIPAIRIHLDGAWDDVGCAWGRLLKKHPIKARTR